MELWREIQKNSITSLEELLSFCQITSFQNKRKKTNFPLLIPRRLAEKIEKGNLKDPILKQFLPTLEEEISQAGFIADPVQDLSFQKGGRILQKYRKRALLITTGACAMNCRFCFRQNFPYSSLEDPLFTPSLEHLQQETSLEEVILSGGDPLSLSNQSLATLLEGLATISHIKRIRFHTRFPIGIPERIDPSFLSLLEKSPQQTIFILHCNHANEFDADIFASLKKIQRLGIPILTQTVLLKGVNDQEEILENLFSLLANHGLLAYYLHQLDPVTGTTHFEVPIERGLELISYLRANLSGYAVPEYVQEIPGKSSKTEVSTR